MWLLAMLRFHEDMPGASDQTILQVDRTRTWLEHVVLATFVDLVGETPAFRKEIIHAIAITTRDIGRRALGRAERAGASSPSARCRTAASC